MKYYVVQKANSPLIGMYEPKYKWWSKDKEFVLVAVFNSIEELIKIDRD
jgi:hypothetical protein